MTAIVIAALTVSGLLWVLAMVEFSRTWSELSVCRQLACELMAVTEERAGRRG